MNRTRRQGPKAKSALGHFQTSAHRRLISALASNADMPSSPRNVGFVPEAAFIQTNGIMERAAIESVGAHDRFLK